MLGIKTPGVMPASFRLRAEHDFYNQPNIKVKPCTAHISHDTCAMCPNLAKMHGVVYSSCYFLFAAVYSAAHHPLQTNS